MFMYVEMRKYMKKKLFSVLLVGALAASLVACGKTEKKEAKASTANTEINAEEYAGTITSNAGVYKTFVNLSDWKGMSVDLKESDYVVLDSDVEDYIKSMLESKATTNVITEGTTKAGDVIKLDYSGKLDGTAFSGGTATDVTYTELSSIPNEAALAATHSSVSSGTTDSSISLTVTVNTVVFPARSEL